MIILYYPDGPNIIIRFLKSEDGSVSVKVMLHEKDSTDCEHERRS